MLQLISIRSPEGNAGLLITAIICTDFKKILLRFLPVFQMSFSFYTVKITQSNVWWCYSLYLYRFNFICYFTSYTLICLNSKHYKMQLAWKLFIDPNWGVHYIYTDQICMGSTLFKLFACLLTSRQLCQNVFICFTWCIYDNHNWLAI